MGSLAGHEDHEKNSAFTWEVKANDRAYNNQFKEKAFLCLRRKKYKDNIIRTAKYNFFSFLPLNLYEQFQRVSNLFFLLIIILQCIPEISTLPWITLCIPLASLLIIRATRDLVDDIGRHRSDNTINNRPCQMLVGKSFLWRKWKNLCVGDLVCLHRDNIVPADMLLLASTEPSSLCYVETADIDGETNLKFRQAPMVTHHELTNIRKMASFQGKVVCEEPNSRMHHFVGCLEWDGKKYPLDSGHILLRGCKIRNTDTCYGMVLYAGFDTKIMRNCGEIHLKRTKTDRLLNRLVILIFLALMLLSSALTLSFWYTMSDLKGEYHYRGAKHKYSLAIETFLVFWAFLVLLSVMVPMAMFVLAEFIYLGNSIFINWDVHMYYKPQDRPARARNTSLTDQLGQVEYIFSDKTGTLTENIMTFKKCCINGIVYGPEEEEVPHKENSFLWNKFADGKLLFRNLKLMNAMLDRKDPMVQEFWRLLAICHTVMVQEKDNKLVYQAASPDEEALVTAARNFGYVFLARTQDSITVEELGEERVYQVLAIMDFNSIRKRMSVLVRDPEGSIYLYTKGADIVIFDLLCKKGLLEWNTEEALASFAQETLRTLCLAYKKVDEDVYEDWHQRHQEASILLQNRAHALHQLYEEMEQNLQLLGATAIEDRLQDGVPETIQRLKQGNIKVWVLTGDKQETAVNIGFACRLLSEDMVILEDKEIVRILDTCRESNNNVLSDKDSLKDMFLPQVQKAMVINGELLDQLLQSLHKEPRTLVQDVSVDMESWQGTEERAPDFQKARRISLLWQSLGTQLRSMRSRDTSSSKSPEVQRERAFVELASQCQAVICCRVTPKQKALVVALVKKYRNVVTLAIGDGANDVNMIKTADVGVGLAGQEGMQAVQSSDYVLAQFRFLQRLLLVHGRWSYMRICKFLRYFIYKTVASMMVQVWFAFYSGFTAQPLYESWFLALYNLLYTTLPVLYIGLFEQDLSAKQSLELPELYVDGQQDRLFNYWVFLQAVAHGMATSLINFFVPLWVSRDTAEPLSFSDYQSFAEVVALSCLLSVTVEVILIIKYWTVLCVLAISLSLCLYMVITWASQSFWLFKASPVAFAFLYANRNMVSQPSALLVVLLNVSLNTLPVLAFRIIYQTLKEPPPKEAAEAVQAAEESQVPEAPSQEVVTMDTQPYLHRGSRSRRSSYAFSHREGYADLITQGTILRRSLAIDSDLLVDQRFLSDDEFVLNITRSPWYRRRMSQLQEKASSEDMPSSSTTSSYLTVVERTSCTRSTTPSTNVDSGSSLRKPSVKQVQLYSPEGLPPTTERPLSPRESQPLPLYQSSLENQPAALEEKQSFWKMSLLSWKSWRKETHSSEVETAAPPGETQTPCAAAETLPPSRAGSVTAYQATEVEPSAPETQLSPTERPPGPGGQPSDTPPGTAASLPSPHEGR